MFRSVNIYQQLKMRSEVVKWRRGGEGSPVRHFPTLSLAVSLRIPTSYLVLLFWPGCDATSTLTSAPSFLTNSDWTPKRNSSDPGSSQEREHTTYQLHFPPCKNLKHIIIVVKRSNVNRVRREGQPGFLGSFTNTCHVLFTPKSPTPTPTF